MKIRLPDFLRVRIHHDCESLPRPALRLEAGLGKALTAAYRQKKIAVLHGKITRTVPRSAAASGKERMRAGNGIYRAHAGDDRNAQKIDKFEKLFMHTGEPDAVPREEDRPLRHLKSVRDLRDHRIRNLRRQQISIFLRIEGRKRLRLHGSTLDIQRDVEPCRSGSSRTGGKEGTLEMVADLLRFPDKLRVLCDRANDGCDVALLDPPAPQLKAGGFDARRVTGLAG